VTDAIDLPLGANLLIVRPDQTILAVTRRHKDTLCLPGGGRESGESARENAVRETFEETGLVVPLTALQGLYSGLCDVDPKTGKTYFVDAFLVSWVPAYGEPVQKEDGIRVLWTTARDFLENTEFLNYNAALIAAWQALSLS
jgi:8-oxo-dGTP pyrophosphatase MutT (NUDIX family)